MRIVTLGLLSAATLLAGCATTGGGHYGGDPRYASYGQYDYDRHDPAYDRYYADQYYVDDPRYGERRLTDNDRIYAGRNGRYYCRRSDGTTGAIVGGIAGGALGAAFTSGTLGTLLGAGAGAIAGASIDRNNVRCR